MAMATYDRFCLENRLVGPDDKIQLAERLISAFPRILFPSAARAAFLRGELLIRDAFQLSGQHPVLQVLKLLSEQVLERTDGRGPLSEGDPLTGAFLYGDALYRKNASR
jgi:hypothetical protein